MEIFDGKPLRKCCVPRLIEQIFQGNERPDHFFLFGVVPGTNSGFSAFAI